ncbi:unnamed protein product [Pleuronectes platessa]|uniref:Uncharacterized protein n=1 Tax=Pleuronectes platessa TaxID=8262 RepID=A0A9N7TPS8_PLEPL|nr:unnamed protein product [Pleuronectes platessa]
MSLKQEKKAASCPSAPNNTDTDRRRSSGAAAAAHSPAPVGKTAPDSVDNAVTVFLWKNTEPSTSEDTNQAPGNPRNSGLNTSPLFPLGHGATQGAKWSTCTPTALNASKEDAW